MNRHALRPGDAVIAPVQPPVKSDASGVEIEKQGRKLRKDGGEHSQRHTPQLKPAEAVPDTQKEHDKTVKPRKTLSKVCNAVKDGGGQQKQGIEEEQNIKCLVFHGTNEWFESEHCFFDLRAE